MSCGEDEQLSDFGFFAMSSLNISSLSRAEVGNFDLEAGDFAKRAISRMMRVLTDANFVGKH